MADAKRDKEHLGIDTNVLVSYLDGAHPEHKNVDWLRDESIVLNPTIIHEAYHTLVFKARWNPEDASRALLDACSDPANLFVNQTQRTTKLGLEIAVKHHLGGRDSLILANLLGAKVKELFSFDQGLVELKRIEFAKRALAIKTP